MDTFKVTLDWILENCTKPGGYTKTQLYMLDVEWPPKKGWKLNAVGMIITEEQKKKFEDAGAQGSKKLNKKR